MSETKKSEKSSESSTESSSGTSWFSPSWTSWVPVPSIPSVPDWVGVPSWVTSWIPWGIQETKEEGKYRDDFPPSQPKRGSLEEAEEDDTLSDEEEVTVNVTMTSIGTITMRFHSDTTKEEMRRQIAKKYFPDSVSVYLSRPSGSDWPFERAGDVADSDIFALSKVRGL